MNINKIHIFTLHRYFLWANGMRDLFDKSTQSGFTTINSKKGIECFHYMSYWYAGLYVVIEGWRELGLTDIKIDELLNSDNVDLLRLYRNGVFHYQKDYFSKKCEGFVAKGKETVKWVKQLNNEFGRFFLNWLKENKSN